MISPDFLAILVCPETKQALCLADAALLDKVNAWIQRGGVMNQGGREVNAALEAGLVTEKNPTVIYPVRQDIPLLMSEEAISLTAIA